MTDLAVSALTDVILTGLLFFLAGLSFRPCVELGSPGWFWAAYLAVSGAATMLGAIGHGFLEPVDHPAGPVLQLVTRAALAVGILLVLLATTRQFMGTRWRRIVDAIGATVLAVDLWAIWTADNLLPLVVANAATMLLALGLHLRGLRSGNGSVAMSIGIVMLIASSLMVPIGGDGVAGLGLYGTVHVALMPTVFVLFLGGRRLRRTRQPESGTCDVGTALRCGYRRDHAVERQCGRRRSLTTEWAAQSSPPEGTLMFPVFLPSLLFYLQAAGHTGYAALQAKRGRLDNPGLVRGSHAMRRALEAVGVRFEVSGLDQVDWGGGPYVFVANHMSALETQILPSILHQGAPCTFVTKSSLLRYPVFGAVLRAFDPIVVNRVDPRADLKQVIEQGCQRLRDGVSVIIFPQARRTPGFDRRMFNSIGMRLARAANVPMVPIALDTATWTEGRMLKDIGWIVPSRPARFAVGAPIPIGADGQAAHRRVMAFIETRLATWSAGSGGATIAAASQDGQRQVDRIGVQVGPDPVIPAP